MTIALIPCDPTSNEQVTRFMANSPIDIAGEAKRRSDDGSRADFCIGEVSRSVRVHQTSLTIEDSKYLYGPPHGQLLVIAEKNSPSAAADPDTAIAVDHLTRLLLREDYWFRSLSRQSWQSLQENLKSMLWSATEDQSISGQSDGAAKSLATLVALITWPHVAIVGLGRGAAFLVRNDLCTPLTELSEEKHGDKAVLPNSMHSISTQSSWRGELTEGDTLVVCSTVATESLGASDFATACGNPRDSAKTCANKIISRLGDHADSDRLAAAAIVARKLNLPKNDEIALAEKTTTHSALL